ncbi:histidine phosphatase family protein [Gryllotalpicola ginsengisoli]|uniref:histidine phosphatase family protein n=1 Tax=Gryllotalpicola ginsengisoli TaxID=444608 RepID=UPI0003B363CC|nr:histidine phosphatase family protein [Gryllotalpicola ginsengisoli]
MTSISLVRHGQTDWNRDKRIQGRSDIPLNDTGRAQARETGRALKGRRFDGVYASPLRRAFETAQIIAGELGMPEPVPVRGLEERSYGLAEGLTGPEIEASWGADRSRVPEWEDDESLLLRVHAALSSLAAAHPGESILVVAHGGVIGALVRQATDGARPARGEVIHNGSVHEFEYTDAGLALRRFNVPASELALVDDAPDDDEAAGAA